MLDKAAKAAVFVRFRIAGSFLAPEPSHPKEP